MKNMTRGFFTGLVLLTAVGISFAEPYAYPVPFVARQSNGTITFKDLPNDGSIRIFTVAGEELNKLDIPLGQLSLPWNVTNSSGKPLATGVYFYEVVGGGDTTIGKLVVIR